MSLYYKNGAKAQILHEGTDYFSFFNFCGSLSDNCRVTSQKPFSRL